MYLHLLLMKKTNRYTSELKDMNAGQNVFQYNIQLNSKLNN